MFILSTSLEDIIVTLLPLDSNDFIKGIIVHLYYRAPEQFDPL